MLFVNSISSPSEKLQQQYKNCILCHTVYSPGQEEAGVLDVTPKREDRAKETDSMSSHQDSILCNRIFVFCFLFLTCKHLGMCLQSSDGRTPGEPGWPRTLQDNAPLSPGSLEHVFSSAEAGTREWLGTLRWRWGYSAQNKHTHLNFRSIFYTFFRGSCWVMFQR